MRLLFLFTKISFIFFIAILTLSAHAKWEAIPFTDTNVKQYIDFQRIDKNRKPYPGLWVLMDLDSSSNSEKYKSVVTYMEFDCVAKKQRLSIAYTYKGSMGNGGIVDTIDMPTAFKMPAPDSPPEFYMKIVCQK